MLAEILFYDVVLAVHILAVVVAFGVTFAYPFMEMAARRGRIEDIAAMHRFQVVLTRFLIQPAMVVVLAAGFYLAQDRDLFEETYVTVPFVILIVLFGLVGAVFAPTERKLAELAQRDLAGGGGQLGDEYRGVLRRMQIAGPIAWLLIAAAIFLMTTKPS